MQEGENGSEKNMEFRRKICKDDFTRRWMLFRYLVQSVMSYRVEVWGWKEKESLEKMMDYIRWMFRLAFYTLRCIIKGVENG